MVKIQLTGEDVIHLMNNSKVIGNKLSGIDLGIEWIQSAEPAISLLQRQKGEALEYLAKYGDHLHECAKTYSEEEQCTCGFTDMVANVCGDSGI